MLYTLHRIFSFYIPRCSKKPEIRRSTFTTASLIPNISKFHFFCQYGFFISLFHKFIYPRGSIKYYHTGLRFHETYFYGMKNKKPYEQSSPWGHIPESVDNCRMRQLSKQQKSHTTSKTYS